MLLNTLAFPNDKAPKILSIGAHCDDIEIGSGGLQMALAAAYPDADMRWHVFSSSDTRAAETRRAAQQFCGGVVNVSTSTFRNGFFPSEHAAIKEYFEGIKKDWDPNLIITHTANDLHQDHRILAELTWNTFRDHLILEYEIPKYDGDTGNPSLFLPLSDQQAQRKARIILDCFESQRNRRWFTEETFISIMRLRGVQSGSAEGYAEAFYCRKQNISVK